MQQDLGEEDSLLVALAGHGVQFRGESESYFCPADARLADRKTLIPLGEVYKELEASGAGMKVLLVDACRNDPQSDNSRARAVVRPSSRARVARARTMQRTRYESHAIRTNAVTRTLEMLLLARPFDLWS